MTDKEVTPTENLQYTTKIAKYREEELHKWLTFKKGCKAYANNMWINNTCRITDRDCYIDDCFAFQLTKLIKGFF